MLFEAGLMCSTSLLFGPAPTRVLRLLLGTAQVYTLSGEIATLVGKCTLRRAGKCTLLAPPFAQAKRAWAPSQKKEQVDVDIVVKDLREAVEAFDGFLQKTSTWRKPFEWITAVTELRGLARTFGAVRSAAFDCKDDRS